MSASERRTFSGSAIGVAAGTVVGAIAGNAGWGAAIGTAAGAAGGYLYDRDQKGQANSLPTGLSTGPDGELINLNSCVKRNDIRRLTVNSGCRFFY